LVKEGCFIAGGQWLTPIILTTLEAEIRRIAVQSQPGHSSLRPYFGGGGRGTQMDWWNGSRWEALNFNPSATRKKKKKRVVS
jgi:hypothetical protein